MTAGPDPFQSSGSLFFHRIDHSITFTSSKHIPYQRGSNFVLYITGPLSGYISQSRFLILFRVSTRIRYTSSSSRNTVPSCAIRHHESRLQYHDSRGRNPPVISIRRCDSSFENNGKYGRPRLHPYGGLTGNQQHVPTTQQTMYNIPYSHYALLYIDGDGKLGIEVSPSIGGSERAIFTDDVRGRFMRSVAGGPSSYPSGEWLAPKQRGLKKEE